MRGDGLKLDKEIHHIVPEILRYIDENVYTTLSVGKIAQAMHYNSEYLRRVFKKNTGESLSVYVKKRRMEASAEYLLRTDAALSTVMETLGYADRKRFYRHFKEVFGVTPGRYRIENEKSKKLR